MNISDFISEIWLMYVKISNLWQINYNGLHFNQKSTTIKKVNANSQMCKTIIDYRDFILENYNLIREIRYLKDEKYATNIECRIKNLNSIIQKMSGYTNSKLHEYGEIPTNKCFNDLFGMRYIYSNDKKVTIEDLESIIENLALSKNIKVIDSSKPDYGYKAIHIYFKLDNLSFPWELQFWDEIDEQNNRESHKRYKQNYTNIESEYKTEENKI